MAFKISKSVIYGIPIFHHRIITCFFNHDFNFIHTSARHWFQTVPEILLSTAYPPGFVFEPALIAVAPRETILFLNTSLSLGRNGDFKVFIPDSIRTDQLKKIFVLHYEIRFNNPFCRSESWKGNRKFTFPVLFLKIINV